MRNRSLVICIALAVLALVLSACGSPTPTPTPSPRTPAAGAATSTGTTATEESTPAVTTEASAAATEMATVEVTAAPTEEASATATEMATAEVTAAASETAIAELPTMEATATEMATATEEASATATEAATTEATATTLAPTQEVLGTKPATLPECRTTGTLTVGSDAAYPPFESIDPSTGEIVGFDVELLQAIAKKAGFEVEFRNALFDTIFTALSYGQYDLVISAATITEERQQTVNFSNPYFVAGQVIVVRKDDVGKIKTTADLAGKTLGVQLGTTGADAAKKIADVKDIKEYEKAPDAFQALSNGTVDAVINDNVTAFGIILNSPSLNLAVVGQPFTQEFYGIAVRKECTELLDAVNKGLAAVIADGTYAKIFAKYMGEEPGAEFREGGAGIVPTAAATSEAGGTGGTGTTATMEATATEAATATATEAGATETPAATMEGTAATP